MKEEKTPSIIQQADAVLAIKRLKELDAKISILELMDKLGTSAVLNAIEEICNDEIGAKR